MAVRAIANMGELRALIGAANKLTVVDAFATWCGPCKVIAPQVDELARKYGDVQFAKVDVDQLQEFAAEYNIRAMPTFLYFKNSSEVTRFEGADVRRLEALVVEHKPKEAPPIPDDEAMQNMRAKELLTLMAMHNVARDGAAEKSEIIALLKAKRDAKK